MGEVRPWKDGTIMYIPPSSVPMLGLASSGNSIFLTSGGGGRIASKEVPNTVQAHRYDEAAKTVTTVATLNTEKDVVVNLSYSPAFGVWLASSVDTCRILELSDDLSTLRQVCQWRTQTAGKMPEQNVARASCDGKWIATGGTDGIVQIWRCEQPTEQPPLHLSCKQYKEVLDLDFSPDGTLLASSHDSGDVHLWDTATGAEKQTIKFDGPKGPYMIRGVRFIAAEEGDGPPLLLVTVRGKPCSIALFSIAGKKLAEKSLGSDPPNALAVDDTGRFAAVNIVNGEKMVFALPSLRCIRKAKGTHDLPAGCVSILGTTSVSGGGDRIINLMPFKKDSTGRLSGGTFIQLACFLFVFAMLFYLVLRLGMKGAALQQGQGEL